MKSRLNWQEPLIEGNMSDKPVPPPKPTPPPSRSPLPDANRSVPNNPSPPPPPAKKR
mgnify:CR=1 FL=1